MYGHKGVPTVSFPLTETEAVKPNVSWLQSSVECFPVSFQLLLLFSVCQHFPVVYVQGSLSALCWTSNSSVVPVLSCKISVVLMSLSMYCHMTSSVCCHVLSHDISVLSCTVTWHQCVVMYCHMTLSVWEVIFCMCRIHQNSKRCKAYDTDLVSRGWLFYSPSAKWVGAETGAFFCMLLTWDHGLDPPRF